MGNLVSDQYHLMAEQNVLCLSGQSRCVIYTSGLKYSLSGVHILHHKNDTGTIGISGSYTLLGSPGLCVCVCGGVFVCACVCGCVWGNILSTLYQDIL